ncbi:TIR domain-containing protein, partial [Pseudofrankia sp. BMG5.36]|uniref:toll/interleukin-1 receptor domain-containing protein n=2 Tax=unclassified Pseudofrankia TaxID=2994372 RepID=UPI000A92F40E
MSGTRIDDEPDEWDFFVSYTAADAEWAEWVAWQLEDAGYRVLIQAWDFVPGSDWMFRIQQGIAHARRTIALVSAAYLRSVYGGEEWRAARAADPEGFARKLLPIRIEDCDLPGLLRTVVWIDLFGRPPEAARSHLLERVGHAVANRAKPPVAPPFPVPDGAAPPSAEPPFPLPQPIERHFTVAHRYTFTGRADSAQTVAFSPDGTLLATSSWDKTARVWDTTSGTLHATLTGHTDWVHAVAFSPDGTLLATSSADRTVRIWDPKSGTPRAFLIGHTGAVGSVAFSPDGTLLATSSADRTVRIWGATSGTLRTTLTGHTGAVGPVAFSPDGTLLATSSWDKTARVWDTTSGTL